MKCKCGAYLNQLWTNCQICGASVISKKNYDNFNIEQIQTFLGEDWELYKDNAEALAGWADLLSERQQMECGEIPKDFTAITHCTCCGDVLVPPALVNKGLVYGCPWCLNKSKQLPIPHPITNNQQLE